MILLAAITDDWLEARLLSGPRRRRGPQEPGWAGLGWARLRPAAKTSRARPSGWSYFVYSSESPPRAGRPGACWAPPSTLLGRRTVLA